MVVTGKSNGALDAGNILFLDLGAGYTGVFGL